MIILYFIYIYSLGLDYIQSSIVDSELMNLTVPIQLSVDK